MSGGLDEYEIPELNDFADGYGVGTSIANARTVDFALDIVEIESKPVAKRGKKSGRKQVLRCDECFATLVVPRSYPHSRLPCPCGGTRRELLTPAIETGKVIAETRPDLQVRQFVLDQLGQVELLPPRPQLRTAIHPLTTPTSRG